MKEPSGLFTCSRIQQLILPPSVLTDSSLPTCSGHSRPVRRAVEFDGPRVQVCDRENYFFRLHFSAYDLAQSTMREKQAMRKMMKTTFSIAQMYHSDDSLPRLKTS